jgi:hypothetical protein
MKNYSIKFGHILIIIAILILAFKGIRIEIVHKGIPEKIKLDQSIHTDELRIQHNFHPNAKINLKHSKEY